MDETRTQSQSPRAIAWPWLIGIAVALIAGAVYLWTTWWADYPPKDSLRHEWMSASLDVVSGLVIVGLVGLAVWRIQKAAEDRRRDDELAAEDRRRVDEVVAGFAREVVVAYNGVKQVRRMLEAEASSDVPPDAKISADAYNRELIALCSYQRDFEGLKRRAKTLQSRVESAQNITAKHARRGRDRPLGLWGSGHWIVDERKWKDAEGDGRRLAELCERIENNLDELVEEYQHNLARVRADEPFLLRYLEPRTPAMTIESQAQLPVFMFDTDCFQFHITRYVDAIIECLDARLLGLPRPENARPSSSTDDSGAP